MLKGTSSLSKEFIYMQIINFQSILLTRTESVEVGGVFFQKSHKFVQLIRTKTGSCCWWRIDLLVVSLGVCEGIPKGTNRGDLKLKLRSDIDYSQINHEVRLHTGWNFRKEKNPYLSHSHFGQPDYYYEVGIFLLEEWTDQNNLSHSDYSGSLYSSHKGEKNKNGAQ